MNKIKHKNVNLKKKLNIIKKFYIFILTNKNLN